MNEEFSVTPIETATITSTIRDENLPAIVSEQVAIIANLTKQINSSFALASDAKKDAETAKKITETMGFWGGRRDAINELQKSGYKLSEAVCSNAEALKMAFEALKKIASATKYLFELGVNNIAATRSIITQLEAQLRGASAEQLSEMAQKEVLAVVCQLKAQEDLLIKQEKLTAKVRTHDDQLHSQSEKDAQHDEFLERQAEKDIQHDELLQRQFEKDQQLDEKLLTIAEKYKELETAFASLLDAQKALQTRSDHNSQLIEKQESAIKQLNAITANSARRFNIEGRISLAFAIAALIGTVTLFALRFC
jgi:hypothetical protein